MVAHDRGRELAGTLIWPRRAVALGFRHDLSEHREALQDRTWRPVLTPDSEEPGRTREDTEPRTVSFWIRYWSRPTATGAEGRAIDHVASDQFHEAGVEVGDWMYVITYRHGLLHVVTSLRVAHLVSRERAQELLGHSNLWDARWHVIARPETVRPAILSATLSDTQTAAIVFIGRDGKRARPARNRRGAIDPQTFRTVRRVDPSTAAVFKDVLDASW
jgi:hypothetical protein